MRKIEIPSPFNKYDKEWFIEFIKTYNSEFYINDEYINIFYTKLILKLTLNQFCM